MEGTERMLTVRQAAAVLQVSPVTVQRWLHAGKLRGVKPGGSRMGWRVSEAEVRRMLQGERDDAE
jgi:excisionase family DNA binding protein